MGAIMMGLVLGLIVAITVYLIGSMFRSIQDEKRKSGVRNTWKHFGLSIAFCLLFLLSWAGQGVSQWQRYTDDQREHHQETSIGDFVSDFSQSTLENWQSEFLQLFSFVVLAALYIHKGSAESKDTDEEIQQVLARIEEKLGTDRS